MKGLNPFLPQYEHIPDGEPRIFGNRLYLFGSHDKSHGAEFCMEDYVCWSTDVDDLCDWRYEGVIYRKEQDPFNKNKEHYMYAPDVVQGVDGRYYLYYALDTVGRISVAVCDTPGGKYEFYGIVGKKDSCGNFQELKEPFPFDPGVLVEDGKVYLYFGFCPSEIDKKIPMLSNETGSAVCQLEADMVTVKSEPHFLVPGFKQAGGTSFENHPFFEASSIRKAGDKYYFIYSSILSHELCYATSVFPDRGFSYGGTIISNGDIGYNGRPENLRIAYTGNNHGSIVKIKEQWYVFYHRHTQAIRCCRQACAERIEILEDGRIPQVEITTSGLYGKPVPAQGKYESAVCCNLIGSEGALHIESEKHMRDKIPYVTEENGVSFIANLQDGTQIGYKYFLFERKEGKLAVTLKGEAQGILQIWLDGGCDDRMTGRKGTYAGEVQVSDSAKWKLYQTNVVYREGIHGLFFSFSGTGSMDFMNYEFC